LADRLDELARLHGLHATRQRSFRVEGAGGLARIAEAMARLRAAPPAEVGGRTVERFEDLAVPDPARRLPPGDVVVLRLEGARVIVRPSGTEPKLKCYLEAVVAVPDGPDGPAWARAEGERALDALDQSMTTLLALTP
jgi:phosphomannomutase